jgi:lysozyme
MSEIDLLMTIIKRFEGCSLKPYSCPAGVLTIGWGATGIGVSYESIWTQAEADSRLRFDANKFLIGTKKLLPNLSGSRLVACADFAYNLGLGSLKTSTLRRKVLAGDFDAVPKQLLRWNRAGGKVLRGLTLRRQAEVTLFTTR